MKSRGMNRDILVCGVPEILGSSPRMTRVGVWRERMKTAMNFNAKTRRTQRDLPVGMEGSTLFAGFVVYGFCCGGVGAVVVCDSVLAGGSFGGDVPGGVEEEGVGIVFGGEPGYFCGPVAFGGDGGPFV